MRNYSHGTNIADFDAVRLAVASATDIADWSYGEVTKPETINYRTQKPERDGLFCERIFGPVKDINPHDAKYKGVRSREAAVDKNGELVTRSIVRRERMGHINLAVPVMHIWFLRGTPSAVGLLLGTTVKNLERVAYFASYVIKDVNVAKRDQMLADKEAEFTAGKEAIKLRHEKTAEEDGANVRALAESQTKETEELTKDFELLKEQLTSLEKMRLMNESDYRALPEDVAELITVGMGGGALRDLLLEIDLEQLIADLTKESDEAKGQRKKKLMKRLRLLEGMSRAGIKPSSMCLTVLPVIPPDLRPMVQLTGGRFATSDLNDLYRRVINRNNRLKKLMDLNAPEVIRRNEQRMLQEAVDALIDNNPARSGRAVAATGQRRRLKSLSDMLKGKQGRFRQNLLGKRVDYSGRSVIVSGPELKIDQCGLPKMMALELFKPFVIGELIEREQAHNIRSATRMIELGDTAVWDALDVSIKDKYVLLNRAPSLHRLSIQAFKPVLIEGRAIQLHPLVCKGFNADFDGDQMAVHLPLSDEAQAEAKNIMAANRNLLKPADGSPILHIEQEIVLGCYYLTYDSPRTTDKTPQTFSSLEEALMAYDDGAGAIGLQTWVRVPFRGQTRSTTLGRLLFNEVFPEDFDFKDEAMTKKRLQVVMAEVYQKYGQEQTALIADDLKDLGFAYATKSGLSIGIEDFRSIVGMPKLVKEGEEHTAAISEQYEQGFITEAERVHLTIENWIKIRDQVQAMLTDQMIGQDTAVAIAITSGARGNISQLRDAVGMLGVLSDASGRAIELPIKSGYVQGLSPLEYFTGTRGTRKALIDIALKTADAGYLTRRLVDVAQDVFTMEDDELDEGFAMLRSDAIEIGVSYGSRLEGRFAAMPITGIVKRGELITKEIAEKIDAQADTDGVKIMSVLSVSSIRGVPQKSYGVDPATGLLVEPHHPIGVIAAQSIGEPSTQLSLDSKHRSGAMIVDDTAQGLSRVEELFEARLPKGQAYLSDIGGLLNTWEEGDHYVVQITADEGQKVKLALGGRTPQVANGSDVAIGDVLAAQDDQADPLISPIAGKVHLTNKAVLITPGKQSVVRYEIPGFKQLSVKDGDSVTAGQRLTNGSLNLQDLMRLAGVDATQRYIVNEVLKIFVGQQGQNIADKHLEIIVRQMFSRVQVEDAGDSEFVTGDIVSKVAVNEANEALAAAGKRPAVVNQLLLGITKASLATDSFLSAASFQDTTRVLIGAATSGKVDKLYGLKENVILGRKIPVGTGYAPAEPIKELDEQFVAVDE